MKRQDFDDLVQRIETQFGGKQPALERSTAAWIRFGLAGILLWLCVLFGLGAAAFVGGVIVAPSIGVWLLGLGVLLIVYALSQAGYVLLVEGAPSEGHRLRPGEAPALKMLLDSLSIELQSRPFDEVWITLKFNAGVREIPRLGLLGWPRSVLEIGLPLALALSPEELRAVLAHEFAHLSSRHGQSGNRMYRLHRTWCNIIARMQRPPKGTLDRTVRGAISRFLDWYWPRLHARAMVLSRMQEVQADRVATELAGGDTQVLALWRIECLNSWFAERFWPDLYQSADHEPDPPVEVIDRIRRGLQVSPGQDDSARWVERGLSRATDNDDTHPALHDRIRAIGKRTDYLRQMGIPTAANPSAAEALLDQALASIEGELAAKWQLASRAAWRERHRQANAQAKRQGSVDSTITAVRPEDLAALWESARDTANVRGPAAAEPLLRAVLEREPCHPGASVLFGHSRLRLGDLEGERLLLQVVEQADETWMPAACSALEQHYQATGQIDQLKHVRMRLDEYEAAVAGARRERSTIKASDSFLPHALTADHLEPLLHLLASEPDCGAAWLARKELRFFPHRRLFVLCVRGGTSWSAPGTSDRERSLAQRLGCRVELPGQMLVITRHGSLRKLARRITSRPDFEIYREYRSASPPP